MLGQTVSFSASATGGSGSYTSYQWTIDGQDKGTGTSQEYTVPTGDSNAKTVTVTCTVTDSQGQSKAADMDFWQVKITLGAIAFNHATTSHNEDGLNIRENKTTAINAPEYVNGGANKPAAYVKNTSAKIAARFTVLPTDVTSLKIKATSSGCLGDLNETQVAVANGVSQGSVSIGGTPYAAFSASMATPGTILKDTFSWEWQVTAVNGNSIDAATFGTSAGHTVYVLYDTPVAPWSTAADNTLNPWADALEFAVTTIPANNSSAEDAVRVITASLFDQWGLQYDHVRGAPHYIDRNGAFLLGAFMTSSRGNIVNCLDIAAAGYVLARLLGVPHALLGLRPFGYIHPVRIVGMVSYCNNPFYLNPIHSDAPLTPVDALKPERSLFGMHAFNWYESKIYDGCCGPRTGTLSVQQYLNLAIDTSTPPEADEAGSVNQIYPVSVLID